MNDKNQSSYRTVVKGTAIFGGVQVFNILINLVRGKCVALFLGPSGMGIASLFTSTTNTITQFTSFGLNLSAQREISAANEAGNIQKLSRILYVFRRLTLFSGIFAMLIAVLGAPWLSKVTFGNDTYTISFVALSVMLLFTALNSAETAFLQGTRKLKHLAKSSIIGSATGLLAGVPLYYFFGVNGIVPAMIILALVSYISLKHFSRKIPLTYSKMNFCTIFSEGGSMITMGIVLMLASFIGVITLYLVNIYIRKYGNIDDVGFFQAATSITNQYIGLVFTSMAVDYFPRLSAISNDNSKVKKVVSHQLEIVILIITPLLILILVTAPLIIRLLLTTDFLPIIPLLKWLTFGIFFKAISFPLGYISFSKGDKKVFFWLEGIYGNLLQGIGYILGYSLWGLIGIGIALTAVYIMYLVTLLVVCKKRYDFKIDKEFIKILIPSFFAIAISFILTLTTKNNAWIYISEIIILTALSVYSINELNKRLNLKDIISKIIRKKT